MARGLVEATGLALSIAPRDDGFAVTLRAGTTRDMIAEINRRLVEGGVAVYRLQEARTSLEEWFLSVTSRLGASGE